MKNWECPTCRGKNLIRFGRYRWKQIYYCKDCKKKFMTDGLKNKTYNPCIIMNAITFHNLGNTLEESAKLINRRFKVKISKSSVHSWIKEFKDICIYWKIKPQVMKNHKGEILFSHNFQHKGLNYNFKYHKPKLEILCRYPSLIEYLENLENKYLDDIFEKNERCSQLPIRVQTRKDESYNHACKLAELALRTCRNNKERHSAVENFMLVNDSSTIACEVPVWFWEKNLNLGICGHIDILQVRQGKIYILDFKPEANKENDEKVASQLYLYASGLSFRTSIPLKEFRCAWFDETVYYEFNPIESDVRIKGIPPKSWKKNNHILYPE